MKLKLYGTISFSIFFGEFFLSFFLYNANKLVDNCIDFKFTIHRARYS